MTSRELLRKLRCLGATVDPSRGKGGHVMARLGGRFAMILTGSGEIPTGTMRAILRQLGLRPEDLRYRPAPRDPSTNSGSRGDPKRRY